MMWIDELWTSIVTTTQNFADDFSPCHSLQQIKSYQVEKPVLADVFTPSVSSRFTLQKP